MSDYNGQLTHEEGACRRAAELFIEQIHDGFSCDVLAVYKVLGQYPHLEMGGVVHDINATGTYIAQINRASPNIAHLSLGVMQDTGRPATVHTTYKLDENTGGWYAIGEFVPQMLFSREFKIPGLTAIVLGELRKKVLSAPTRQRIQR